MATIVEKISTQLIADPSLWAVLHQRSQAYGSVAGAVEELAHKMVRGQESEPEGRQAFAALVNAIHAPRAEAEKIAVELARLIRDLTAYGEVES